MSSTPNQSLEQVIEQAMQNALDPSAIQATIEEKAKSAIEDAISDAFSRRGAFRESITNAVNEALPTIQAEPLEKFSHAVREVVTRRLGNLAHDTAVEHVGQLLEHILPDSPKITLSELREAYEDKVREQQAIDDCRCVESDDVYITFKVDQSSSATGYWRLTLGPEEGMDWTDSESICLSFSPKHFNDKKPTEFECYNVRSGKIDGREFTSLFAGPVYGFDALVFRLATRTAFLNVEGERAFQR